MLTLFRKHVALFLLVLFAGISAKAQTVRWSADGNGYYRVEQNELVRYAMPSNERKVVLSRQQLTSDGKHTRIENYLFSPDESKALIYTNSQRVWRINTRGDYYAFDFKTGSLKKLGRGLPASSLMFAKFSPDGSKVAYVSNYNLYVEDLASGEIKQLTTDGNRKFINGTFDWVYEEEFACRDGFRWSNDGKQLVFWQIDARDTRDFYMINNTDSVYSQIVPVEYPMVGEDPSACRIAVADVASGRISFMNLEGDARQRYIVRLEFIPQTNDFVLQQLNRKQNESKLLRCNPSTGNCQQIYSEKDDAWVDVYTPASAENAYSVDFRHNVEWLNNGKEFLWTSEKDGWRHVYRVSSDGKKETLLSKGNFDVIAVKGYDESKGTLYFLASPENATQKYLYRARLDGKGNAERVTPSALAGTHNYQVSPGAKFALHTFSNAYTRPVAEMIALPAHKALNEDESIAKKLPAAEGEKATEFFRIRTSDNVEMDGWMVKPRDFDPAKKYPVVFYVYTEPWGQNVTDTYGVSNNFLYEGDMRDDGYIYISIDNRGTPAPKGRDWRKIIYRKIGQINIRDQAMAAQEILKWPFVDRERIAVWGWSGGGAATLNMMFQYPEIFKTGIAVAAVGNLLTYDNIYQERYMGLPQENMEDFIKGSPITHAKNLQGNLLYIHGTGDDNVHYANAEMLVNELIRHRKLFQFMPYPNRTHGISEGEGTFEHLQALYTTFLRANCPPGPR